MQIWHTELAHGHDHDMQVAVKAGAITLQEALDEHVAELNKVWSMGSGMPQGITDMTGVHGSHHFYLDLTTEEARMVVVLCYGVMSTKFDELFQVTA